MKDIKHKEFTNGIVYALTTNDGAACGQLAIVAE